jgi:hypothetical protein
LDRLTIFPMTSEILEVLLPYLNRKLYSKCASPKEEKCFQPIAGKLQKPFMVHDLAEATKSRISMWFELWQAALPALSTFTLLTNLPNECDYLSTTR